MAKNYRVLLATNVLALSIVLLLSLVTYPFAISVSASTDPLEDDLTTNLNSNNTGSADPLSDAVLTLGDGTSVLNVESAADSSTETVGSGGVTPDSSLESTSDTSSSDSSSVDDSSSRATGSDSSSLGPTGEVGSSTGEAGSSTGEVGSSTGEVLPSDDATGVVIVPSEDAAGATDGTESAGNVSTTDEGTASVGNDDAGASEQPITSPPLPSELDVASGGPVIGAGNNDPSSSSSSADSNGNALAAESISAASAENPNAVVQPVSTDGENTISLGDVSNNQGTSAQLSLDQQSYSPGQTAVVTLSDPAANIDSNFANTVIIVVRSSSSDPGTSVTLTEDGTNSGNFMGSFTVPDGDNLNLSYDASRPQARVAIGGVSQGGSVQVQELPVTSFQSSLGETQPDIMIGNSIQVSLLDGAQLASNDVCDSNSLPPPCGGSTTVTLSYANAPLNNQQPGAFTVWQHIPGIGWVDLRDWSAQGIVVDENTMTVTANSPFGEGVYVIGVNVGGGGGGGGGAGFPGAGLVLDLVAPIVASGSESPPSTPDTPSSSPESTTSLPETPILSVEDDAANTTSSISTITESKPGVGIGEESGIVQVSRNGNTTIAVPGEGNVTLSFTNLLSEGTLTVSAAQDADLAEFKVVKNAGGPAKVMSLDNTPYSLAGAVFVIGPTDSEFKGTITVSVPFKNALVPQGSEVRLLHYTGSGWEDITTQGKLDAATGTMSYLGAVAPAVKLPTVNLVSAAH